MKLLTQTVSLLPLIIFLTTASGKQQELLGTKAPEFGVTEWANLEDGKEILELKDLKGQVVYLYCFQSWCPGCHKYGFPTLIKLVKEFEGDKDVVFLTIQTTFEGYATNTFKGGQAIVSNYKLKIPVGQSGDENTRSTIMKRYQTRGTPWTIIIDKEGTLRYSNFHIKPEDAATLIRKLKG